MSHLRDAERRNPQIGVGFRVVERPILANADSVRLVHALDTGTAAVL
jgi:hypothetical protein